MLFVLIIALGGILTLLLSPMQIFGGLARGYLDAPRSSTVLQKIGNSLKTFDSRVNEYFVFHDLSIHAYGGVQNLINRTLIDDTDKSYEVVKLSNGYLTFKSNRDYDYSGLKQYLIRLNRTCDSVGSKLIYVNKISKDTTEVDLLPLFYPYVYDSNFKSIKTEMEADGITVLDFEDTIVDQNMDKYSLFFKTDHHWKPKAGLWVSQSISKKINEEYNWNLNTELLKINNFFVENYPNSFLGSQGKRVGALYDGVDNFEVIIPTFDTNFSVEINDINYYETGTFEETMLHKESITPNNLLNKDDTAYDTYMKGNHSLVRITNNKIDTKRTALVIMDSYGCVVAPYLALEFKYLDCIDIRSYSDSVEQYIKTMSPDIVIYSITGYQ